MAYIYPQYYQPQNNIVSVRNETEARNYPVAYGATVYFKDDASPFIYIKSMGFSQMEAPRFDRYRLVEEEEQPQAINNTSSDVDERIEAIRADIDALKKAVFKKKVKEVEDDDE